MIDLIPVGFYREQTDDPDEQQVFPSIHDSLCDQPQADEARIAAYLRNGVCLCARGCYEEDVLDPSSSVPLFGHQYTDGKYTWPLHLAHYVEKYHLRLPPEFIRHMASRNWQPPTKEEVDVTSLGF
jgi:hypothetical protein